MDEARKVKFLGVSFCKRKGEKRVRIHPKSVAKMEAKVKELTSRSNEMGKEGRAEGVEVSKHKKELLVNLQKPRQLEVHRHNTFRGLVTSSFQIINDK